MTATGVREPGEDGRRAAPHARQALLNWEALPLPWQAALDEAWQAYGSGSLPIGAVITDARGRLIGRGRNRIADRASPPPAQGRAVVAAHELAHAEINALLSLHYVYANKGEDDDPHGWVMYATMEPCPACMGMFYMSGLRELHYAARDPYAGSVNLLGATPYLSRKPIRVSGPHPALETLSTAITLAWSLENEPKNSSQFVRDWMRPILPQGVALGERLHERGGLRVLRESGASAAEMVARVALELELLTAHWKG
jgi:tRNA(adenine34) deaminase